MTQNQSWQIDWVSDPEGKQYPFYPFQGSGGPFVLMNDSPGYYNKYSFLPQKPPWISSFFQISETSQYVLIKSHIKYMDVENGVLDILMEKCITSAWVLMWLRNRLRRHSCGFLINCSS